ncbi:conserved hypothetical protein [groundwater metagenome]|uniref:DUF5679 domain-containing protein n=1 Tax=groundwater metagenome TaxID=717931 RepID=A0A098E9R6_9ZZZZ
MAAAKATGYCVKCKEKVDIKGAKEVTMKNGRNAMSGTCPKCETKVFCFVKG